jgi:hypothetical protein
MHNCPKCTAPLPAGFIGHDCPNCGIIFSKYYAAQAAKEKTRLAEEAAARKRTEEQEAKRKALDREIAPAVPRAKTASCPTCGGLVAIGAKTCPHCGQAKPAPKKAGAVAYAIAGLFLVLLISGISNSPGVGNRPRYDSFNAQTECEKFVSRTLKAPASADFAPYRELAISGQGDGPWKVVGWVDAQNSFGAKIRNTYVCEVQFTGDTVNLVSMSIR